MKFHFAARKAVTCSSMRIPVAGMKESWIAKQLKNGLSHVPIIIAIMKETWVAKHFQFAFFTPLETDNCSYMHMTIDRNYSLTV